MSDVDTRITSPSAVHLQVQSAPSLPAKGEASPDVSTRVIQQPSQEESLAATKIAHSRDQAQVQSFPLPLAKDEVMSDVTNKDTPLPGDSRRARDPGQSHDHPIEIYYHAEGDDTAPQIIDTGYSHSEGEDVEALSFAEELNVRLPNSKKTKGSL
jgi:hypothetical protein